MMTRSRRLGTLMLMVVGFGMAIPGMASAQSAADKATARQLATDGIQLFRQDRFADALDKLERAQSLFDAPVHLLYIARCQAKLGHLVEAAEAYRRLVRVELSAQAPQTFKEAVADGQKELADVEPKVPTLRVEITPPNVRDVRLSIDGEAVSTAVVGVDRPINPGAHVIEVSAKGQPAVSKRVDVAVASRQVVKLELPNVASVGITAVPGRGASGESSAPSGAASDTSSGSSAGEVTSKPSDPAEAAQGDRDWRRFKIIGGVDIAGTMPISGKLDNKPGTGPADDRAVTGRYGPGGGLELRIGVSIPVTNFSIAPVMFVNANSHEPGTLYKKSADRSFNLPNIDSVMTAEPVSVALGVGARLDTAPTRAWQLAGFGELAFLIQDYSTTGKWTVSETQMSGSCEFTEEFTGFGVRTRGGVLLPVSRAVTLVGAAGVTLSKITSSGLAGKTCDRTELQEQFTVADKASVPSENRTYHAVFGLNLGAEFGIGLGR